MKLAYTFGFLVLSLLLAGCTSSSSNSQQTLIAQPSLNAPFEVKDLQITLTNLTQSNFVGSKYFGTKARIGAKLVIFNVLVKNNGRVSESFSTDNLRARDSEGKTYDVAIDYSSNPRLYDKIEPGLSATYSQLYVEVPSDTNKLDLLVYANVFENPVASVQFALTNTASTSSNTPSQVEQVNSTRVTTQPTIAAYIEQNVSITQIQSYRFSPEEHKLEVTLIKIRSKFEGGKRLLQANIRVKNIGTAADDLFFSLRSVLLDGMGGQYKAIVDSDYFSEPAWDSSAMYPGVVRDGWISFEPLPENVRTATFVFNNIYTEGRFTVDLQ